MLCPRCDIGTLGFKRKPKKLKEPVPNGKKKSTRLESLNDLERALSESKETAAAVCIHLEVVLAIKNWMKLSLLAVFFFNDFLSCMLSDMEVISNFFSLQ